MLNRMNYFLNCTDNSERRELLKSLLVEDNISFTEDPFNRGVNFYCEGSSKYLVVAHYDAVYSEYSANDNTASVINLLEIKKLNPELNVAFLDSEEFPYFAAGSSHMAQRIVNEELTLPEFVINLELTGRGNNWYLGKNQGVISTNKIQSFRKCTEMEVPISDSTRFLEYDIDAVVLTLIPEDEIDIIYKCHSEEDNIDNISISDMQTFVKDFSELIDFLN